MKLARFSKVGSDERKSFQTKADKLWMFLTKNGILDPNNFRVKTLLIITYYQNELG